MTALSYNEAKGNDYSGDVTVISIGAPRTSTPAGVSPSEDNCLRLEFDDLPAPTERQKQMYDPPAPVHVEQIIEHARGHSGRLVTHCRAGVSRSTAADIIGKCARGLDPYEAFRRMLLESPRPWRTQPNQHMLGLAEDQLGMASGTLQKINDGIGQLKQEMQDEGDL